MRFPTQLVAALTLATALAACSNEPTQNAVPAAPRFAASTTCDVTQLKADARNYFGNNQTVSNLIRDLQTACKNADAAGQLDISFNILSWVAQAVRSGTQKGTPTDGANTALDLVPFMGYTPAPAQSDLIKALSPGGLFEVRGRNTTYNNVAEYYASVFSRGSTPTWGVMVAPPFTNWTSNGGFLFYGYPLTDASTLTTETPSVGGTGPIAYGYEIMTYPSGIAFTANSMIVGQCVVPNGTDRIQHYAAGGPNAIQFLTFASLNCPGTQPSGGFASLDAAPSLGKRLGQGLLAMLTPREAWAAFDWGGVGGLASGFSPHVGVNLIAAYTTFLNQPADGFVYTPITDASGNPIRVQVLSAGGNPLAGTIVTMSVAGNNGTNVGISLDGVNYTQSVSVAANAQGIATFTGLSVNKAGGYTLTASSNFDSSITGSARSNLFNIQNK